MRGRDVLISFSDIELSRLLADRLADAAAASEGAIAAGYLSAAKHAEAVARYLATGDATHVAHP